MRANSGRSRKRQIPFKRWKIVRNDKIIVLRGKDKGKTGIVIRVYRKSNKVLVQGINLKMKRYKADPDSEQKAGIRPKMHPLHVSAVALIDPESGKPTRIRFAFLEDGTKVRISKRSNAIIPKNVDPGWKREVRNKNKIDGI
jgi:large subunit ribosomal protein L24